LPGLLLTLLTSRSLVAISTTCAILYGVFWGVGALQAAGLTPAPFGDVLTSQPDTPATTLTQAAMPGSPTPGTGLTLEVQASPTLQPWVTDAANKGAGVNPDTGLVLLQPADSSYSGMGTNPQAIAIPNATGEYHVRLAALTDGPFELHVRLYRGRDASNAREYDGSGQAVAKSTLECDVSIADNSGDAPQLEVTPIRNQTAST
jgi:hypothetical protein